MGRAPCCDKANVKRGPWSPEEDTALKNYVQTHGTGGNWIALPHKAGLKRCGKSCRLRWLNYLRPDIKHGGFTEEEDNIICTLYKTIGSRWSVIASQLPGRTDNDVKNYWNTKLKKKLLAGNTNNITNITTTTITATTTSSSHAHYFTSSSSSSSPNTILNNHDDIDNYGFLSSTFLTHQNLPITPSMDAAVGDLGQAVFSSQRIVLDPTIHHDSFPHQPGVLMDATKLGKSSGNNIKSDIASSCQEISGLSSVAASSPFRVEESYFFWSGNGGGIGSVDDRSLMSFGFNSNFDNNGLGLHQERIPSEAAAENLASYYSLFDNFLDDPSDAKSKVLETN